MKRTKLFSVALLAAAWFAGGSVQAWDEPTQDANGVYQIGTASELEWFAEQVNSGTTTINALLTADITCNAETSYGTIGNSSKPYKGTFDGGGHRIINRNVNTGTNNGAGFFGYLNGGALIKNLILDSSCSFTGNHVVGAFAGAMTGGGTVVFENCVNEAPVTATASNGASAAFVGASQGTTAAAIKVTNSANTGTITCGENGRATVFCSYSNSGSTFINCYNTGMLSKLNASNQNFVQWSNGTPVITNCYELSGVANATQGIIRSSDIVSTGELCYLLNGNQSAITFYQVVGSGKPMPFEVEGGQVYAHGQVYCDGKSAPGTTYDNNGPDTVVNLGHEYTNGICSRDCDAHFQPAAQASDGYYELANAGNVEWFSNNVKAQPGNYTNARLTADIDLDGVIHRPIGEDSGNKYRGIFEGQGHRILNMTQFTQNDRVGFFGATRCQSAYIKDLIIDKSCKITGNNYVGAVVGAIMYPSDPQYTTLENCINEADVEATGSQVGGLIGGAPFNDGTAKIVNCINLGNVTAVGEAGAFIGKSTGTAVIIASYNEGKVLAGQNGSNNLIATGGATFNGACDISGTENGTQGNILPASAKTSGELCYKLNGDQSTISWTQTIGTDAAPVLGTTSSQVYAHGQILCDGTSAPGTLYNNEGPDGVVNLDHDFSQTGFCTVCNEPQPAEQAADGWYEIVNPGNIEWMSKVIQQNATGADGVSYIGSKYRMMNDLDFTGITHTKIGQTENFKFDGTFDGQGHRISNLVMNEPNATSVGFFGYCRGGATLIENLIIDETCSFYGNDRVAAFVGSFQRAAAIVNIQNCVNEATVTAKSKSAAAFVGGGASNGDTPRLYITNCVNAGTITVEAEVSGNDCAAAIIANYNNKGASGGNSTITNCVYIGQVSPLNGQNTMFTGSFRSYNNCYDVTEGKMNNQNIGINWQTANPVEGGELCYKLNGDQTEIAFYQTIGTDGYPVPFATSSQVYESASYNCDGTPLGGVEYTNVSTGEPIIPPHHFNAEIGMCDACYHAEFQEPELVDGWYELKNPGNVEWFSAYVAANHLDINGKLMNDIDFLGIENLHSPIGPDAANKFNGTFDGQGFRIKNMIIERPTDSNIGFFGWLRGNNAPTTVKNLIIDKSCSIHANNRVGGITGTYQNGGSVITIENVVNEATITAEHQDAGGIFGGHEAGNPTVIIRNCMNAGTITAKNEAPYAGALCCYMGVGEGSKIENFLNIGTVNGHLGGNIGRHNIGDVTNLIDLSDTDEKTQGVVDDLTAEDVANGKVAYILGWGQFLDIDDYPSPLAEQTVSYVGDAGYATMYDNATGYVLNGDVEAYVATSNGKWLSLTEIENVPVETPVVLKGTYYNKFAYDVPAINIANDLKGTDADTAADGTMYVLAKVDDKVGFYKATGTIAAGKAYYQSTSGVKAFYFDGDDATGISLMEDGRSQMEDGAIYNIAGQRIQKMQKGINIINGKKVLF